MKDFDEMLEDFINKEMEEINIDRESDEDLDFECQFMKELEPYTSKGVTYFVPRVCQPKYSFRRLELKMEADKLDVLSTLNKELKKDPVKATLVDMTKLNLAEVTRKKVKKSLREQLGSYDYHRN